MKRLSKIRLSTVEDKLSDAEMRSVIGGYGYGGSGTENDPYQLPEIIVTPCSTTSKTTACMDRSLGSPCCWTYEGKVYTGHCSGYALYGQPLHCSDLNVWI
jgi:natural product precursor